MAALELPATKVAAFDNALFSGLKQVSVAQLPPLPRLSVQRYPTPLLQSSGAGQPGICRPTLSPPL
eukprot:9692956-Alexandrium_andersonii.AAC.1